MNKDKKVGNKRFTVYDSEANTVLELLNELGSLTNDVCDSLDNKTDLFGDHKGSWQGLNRPTMSEEGMRATVEDIIDNKIPSIETSLDNIENNNSIIPDRFDGTDFEKIQKCFDYAIKNNRSILFNRLYDIKNNTIIINKEPNPNREPLYISAINNGGIYKNYNGFIFDSKDPFVGDIFIDNTVFKSEDGKGVIVFNGNKLIRVHSSKNKYFNVDGIVKSTNVLQSFRFNQDNMTGGNGTLIDSVNPFDIVVENCLVENGNNFFNSTGTGNGCNSVRIVNSCIENMGGFFFKCDRVENLVIQNNYLEKNLGGHIIFNDLSRQRNVNIIGNIHIGSAESGISSLIKWGSDVGSCISIGNRAINLEIHDTSNITNGYITALEGGGFNSIGTNKFINLQMSKNTINATNGTKTEWGFATKLFNQQNVDINANSTIKVTIPMIENIDKEDSVSVKVYHDDSVPILIKSWYSQNNNVVVWLKNEYTSNISLTVRATVIQLKTI